jgi:hypothetical protein
MQKCWVICSWYGRTELREREIHGIVDQPVNPKPVVGEVVIEQRHVLVGVGILPVVPEIGGDVALGVRAGLRIQMLEHALGRSDQRKRDALHDARVPQRERRCRKPAGRDQDHRQRENGKADPAVVVASCIDVVEVVEQT